PQVHRCDLIWPMDTLLELELPDAEVDGDGFFEVLVDVNQRAGPLRAAAPELQHGAGAAGAQQPLA
ncbi:hypothetical protein PF002_g23359, partial [Phytophthora fragariae]